MFLDEVAITVAAGSGGNGCTSMRREAHVPLGGPDGGNGGSGGNVLLRANPNKNTLHHFVGRKLFRADRGQHGSGQLKAGKGGEDLILEVPIGTLIFENGEQIADLTAPGSTYLAARGGLGGKGNAGFKSPIRQTPRFAELGEPGEEHAVKLELKLVADVGIIGLPSVGKSTMISCISASRPKIAAYHFTTLTPNLGVVSHRGESFVATDLPGLIKGASSGKGLGHRFLRHAERVRCFLHIVGGDSASPVTDYRTIRDELRKWNPNMLKKPEILALSKADLLQPDEREKIADKLEKAAGVRPLLLSAPIHEGLTETLDQLLQVIQSTAVDIEEVSTKIPVYRPHLDEKSRACTVKRKNKTHYIADGPRLNQIVIMTELNNYEALARVQDIMKKFGVDRQLIRLGAEPGATIEIAGKTFEWWG